MGDLREEQLITTFGPGSILDLKNFPVMIESSHKWLGNGSADSNSLLQIHDLSIQTLVEKKLFELTKNGIPIKKIKGLMRPPPENNKFNELLGEVASRPITAKRFPQYHRCTKCNTLSKLSTGDQSTKCKAKAQHNNSGTYETCNGRLEATRWVQICPDGHISDFDWHSYLGCNGNSCGSTENGNSTIQYRDNARTGTFADITISCKSCGSKKNMGPAIKSKGKCHGIKFWSDDFKEDCNKSLKIIPRGKSSIYVSETLQGISLPQMNNFFELPLNHAHYFYVAKQYDDERFIEHFNMEQSQNINPLSSDQEVKEYYKWLKGHASESDFDNLNKDYTKEEFKILTSKDDIKKLDFESHQIKLSDSSFLNSHFSSINKIQKLKIVKSLLGFRRAFPNENENDTFGGKFQPVTIDNQYIPSVESFGEGIFFRFSDKKLKEVTAKNQFDNEVIIHSFSHFLMHELSQYSGYSITALSEKLYLHDGNLGVLIYTSSGDSQCSMGGLSDLAEAHKLEQIILEGLENIKTCSEDPFCINEKESCFSCIMTPEICCYLEPRRKNTALRRSCLTEIDGSKPYFTLS